MNHEKKLKDGTLIVHPDGAYAGLGPQFFAMYCEKWGVEITSDRGQVIYNRSRNGKEAPSEEEMQLCNCPELEKRGHQLECPVVAGRKYPGVMAILHRSC